MEMMRRVTSNDIARAAGVSRTTVSFVLNEKRGTNIRAETKARVLEAAKALGYVPNSAARMLVSGRSRTLGLVLAHGDLMSVDAFAAIELLEGRSVGIRNCILSLKLIVRESCGRNAWYSTDSQLRSGHRHKR
jgi:Bacterial regulatory proteins, lacI family